MGHFSIKILRRKNWKARFLLQVIEFCSEKLENHLKVPEKYIYKVSANNVSMGMRWPTFYFFTLIFISKIKKRRVSFQSSPRALPQYNILFSIQWRIQIYLPFNFWLRIGGAPSFFLIFFFILFCERGCELKLWSG